MEHLRPYADMYSYKEYPKEARKLFRRIIKELNLPKGSYDIRYPGKDTWRCEMTLHHEHFYLHLEPLETTGSAGFVRSCKGRKDYVGGYNRWFGYSWDKLIQHIKEILRHEGYQGTSTIEPGRTEVGNGDEVSGQVSSS